MMLMTRAALGRGRSGAGVGGIIDLLHAGGGDMGVDLGGAEVGVAEKLLDAAEVGAVVEEVGGEAVPEFVRADLEADGGVAQVFLQEVADGAHGDAAAELAEEEGAVVDAGGDAIVLDGAEGGATDGTEAVFAAFAGDAEAFVEVVDVADVEFDEFVEAEAGAVEELEDGGVALGGPDGGTLGAFGFEGEGEGEELVDLAEGEDDGEGALGFGELDFEEGIGGEAGAAGEEFEEAAEGGELDADGGAAEVAFHEHEEPGAEVVGGEVGPGAEGGEAGAEGAEALGVVLQGEGGGVAFDLHELQELGFEGVGDVGQDRGAGGGRGLDGTAGFPGDFGVAGALVLRFGSSAAGGAERGRF